MDDEKIIEGGKITLLAGAGAGAGALVATTAAIALAGPMAIGAGIACIAYGVIKIFKK
ncbi:MAG: hypothetical protein ABIQ27_00995 [Flavobacterium sp.]|uniref:hypothetical protein n=1 Tax=Flavobacterium sp. TaxID=239 RepID=UPI003267B4BC